MPLESSVTEENSQAAPLIPDPEEQASPISPLFQSISPSWSRPQSGPNWSRRRSSSVFSAPAAAGMRDRVINSFERSYQKVAGRFMKMTVLQRIGAVLAALLVMILGLAFMILTGQIFHWLRPVAEEWEKSPLAYFVLWLCAFTVSFPPLVGWSTIGTVSGFLFGVWKGWLVYATATIVGSTCSIILSRTILSKFVRRLIEHDKRFAALSITLKYDGLKLLCMIRLCPLPYSICNGAISTFPTVHPLMYGLATAIITPKLLVSTFVGSRIRILAQHGESMSAGNKAINIISIVVSILVGIFTGWYIYRRTLARAKQLESEEQAANVRQAMHTDPTLLPTPGDFSDGIDGNEVGGRGLPGDEEELVGFRDDDHVALGPLSYHDEFTDNDSDVFRDGDGDGEEAYTLHRHIDSK